MYVWEGRKEVEKMYNLYPHPHSTYYHGQETTSYLMQGSFSVPVYVGGLTPDFTG
jgi:hypothetical protein